MPSEKWDIWGVCDLCTDEEIDAKGFKFANKSSNLVLNENYITKNQKTYLEIPEYCGSICCNKKTGELKATEPYPGYWPKGQVGGQIAYCKTTKTCAEEYGEDFVKVAGYHSHPTYAFRGFSDIDKRKSDKSKVPEYLGTPGDEVSKYTPDPKYNSEKDWHIGINGGNGKVKKFDKDGKIKN